MSPSLSDMLIQWLFLFGWLSILLFPALRFRRIAMENGRKGWVFFIVGVVIGYLILQVATLPMICLKPLPKVQQFSQYLFVVMFAASYLLIFAAERVVRRFISVNK
jgi:hypothetical protein